MSDTYSEYSLVTPVDPAMGSPGLACLSHLKECTLPSIDPNSTSAAAETMIRTLAIRKAAGPTRAFPQGLARIFASPSSTGVPTRQLVNGRQRTMGGKSFHTIPARLQATSQSNKQRKADTPADILYSVTEAPVAGSGTVANVTISNPKRLNSMDRDMVKKLTSTLRQLSQQPDIRCLVVQGATTTTKSPSFTSGANIFQMANISSYEEAEDFISGLHEACQAMRDIPVPTIAKINGLCLGGGLEFAAACDFRYATRTSTFSMPETKFGIPSVIEARLLANLIGWQKAKEMVYFARFYSAEDVEPWGLVDKSCKDVQELEEVVHEAVTTISSFGPKAMREQKALCQIWEESDLASGIEAGIHAYARMFQDGGSEPKHYMKAFTERKQ
ncbi:hypothetical protein ASPVEDRAFT_153560 [Aspergillus versicolor CBS 583.65]|uniref:Enoyl-CoA hydratase n=1 Tax=Aspergillus versicolor CBS 583.65 TaxID=1036611 RepID=A0A1L9PUX0_ASPVE|nr:uncharacterized protein ASPVEDRAFT_153560 [Aspergillus versicolor CBS 583.65]OJJ05327.1 hypothetical protein ASPVEDRAFT_153560 [Aspergillus versicolor CBS 583.65]